METPLTLTATASELQALLALLQRAPMTPAEALFAEYIFNRWLPAPAAEDPQTDPPAG